jgi:hypothetical protein
MAGLVPAINVFNVGIVQSRMPAHSGHDKKHP